MLEIFSTDFNKNLDIPSKMQIAKIQNFTHSLLPTLTIDVRKSGDYDRIIGVQQYEMKFEGVGGMNAPKKIVCRGTDGISRTQLIKVPNKMFLIFLTPNANQSFYCVREKTI